MKSIVILACLFFAGCITVPEDNRTWAEICRDEYGFSIGTDGNSRCALALDMQRREWVLRYFGPRR